jgi:tetratricopeptide (TPR) repeat protein
MKRVSALLMALCLPALPAGHAQAASQASSTQDDEALRLGTDALQTGKFAEAEKWLQSAVDAAPDNPIAQMELGVAELRLGKPGIGISALNHAVSLDPQLQGANLFLGIAYAQMNRLDDAAAALQREIDLAPKNAEAQMWLGIVELKAGRPELATGPLDRAAELSPNDLNILEYRGEAHSDVAHDSYARMAKIDPDSWHVHKVQGQLYALQNKHAEAIAEFREAIHSSPNNSDLYEELGNEYRKSGAMDQAQQAFQKEMELSPNNPVAMYSIASIEIERNEAETGVPLMLKVISNYASAPAAYFYLGLGQSELGKPQDAVAAFEKGLTMHPDHELAARIQYERARAYRKLGETEQANQAISEFLRLKALKDKSGPLTETSDPLKPVPQSAEAEPKGTN